MNQENEVSLKEFNMLAGSIASVWYALDIKGYYLPHLSSLVMISEYLLEIMRGKVFRIEKKNIQKCTLLQKSSEVDLYVKLNERRKKSLLKGLGFTSREFTKKRVINLSAVRSKSFGLSVFETQIRGCWVSDKRGFRIAKIAQYSFSYQEQGFLK